MHITGIDRTLARFAEFAQVETQWLIYEWRLAIAENQAHSFSIIGHFIRRRWLGAILSPEDESADMNSGSTNSLAADQGSSWFSSETDIIQKNAGLVEISYNNCRAISHKLADDLLSNGIHASVMRCSGLRRDAPTADQRWLDIGPQTGWVHFVVRTDSQMVDLTRQQFFPLSDNPFLQGLNLFVDEWDAISVDSFNGRMRSRF